METETTETKSPFSPRAEKAAGIEEGGGLRLFHRAAQQDGTAEDWRQYQVMIYHGWLENLMRATEPIVRAISRFGPEFVASISTEEAETLLNQWQNVQLNHDLGIENSHIPLDKASRKKLQKLEAEDRQRDREPGLFDEPARIAASRR